MSFWAVTPRWLKWPPGVDLGHLGRGPHYTKTENAPRHPGTHRDSPRNHQSRLGKLSPCLAGLSVVTNPPFRVSIHIDGGIFYRTLIGYKYKRD